MVTVIICAIVALVWWVITEINDRWFDWFSAILGSCLMAFLGTVVGLIITLALPADLSTEKYSLKIEALQDGGGVNGHFFLGSGSINGEMQYVFYYEENGLYRMAQVKSNTAAVKYTEGTPKVNITKIVKTKSWINWFASDMSVGDQTYIIEVPKGSIKNSYNLDAQ